MFRPRARQRGIVTAFLTASQTGDFSALLAILDPDVVLRADASAVEASARANVPGIAPEVRGRDPVANIFRGRARAAQYSWQRTARDTLALLGRIAGRRGAVP